MNAHARFAMLLIGAAYLCALAVLVLWVAQATGHPTLGPLTPRTFMNYGWVPPAVLLVGTFWVHTVSDVQWIRSQIAWMLKSFGALLMIAFFGAACLLVGAWLQQEVLAVLAIAAWALGGAWFLYRCVRGAWCLWRQTPVRGLRLWGAASAR